MFKWLKDWITSETMDELNAKIDRLVKCGNGRCAAIDEEIELLKRLCGFELKTIGSEIYLGFTYLEDKRKEAEKQGFRFFYAYQNGVEVWIKKKK